MAIDTNVSETLKNKKHQSMRRGGSPEPSCQLPTAPAYIYLMTEEDYIEKEERLIPLRSYLANSHILIFNRPHALRRII